MMDSRARGANRLCTALGSQAGYRHAPALVRPVRHRRDHRAARGTGRYLLGGIPPLKGSLITPDAPTDPGEFVREGHGSDVVAFAVLEGEGPGAQIVGAGCDVAGPERRARAVDEQHPQIAVAVFSDAAQAAGERARMLPWREAEVGGAVAVRMPTPGTLMRREASGSCRARRSSWSCSAAALAWRVAISSSTSVSAWRR